MLLDRVQFEDISFDVMNVAEIKPFPIGPQDEIFAWKHIVEHPESSTTAYNTGVMLMTNLRKASAAAQAISANRFFRGVVHPGEMTMRIPDVSDAAKICALTAFSRFTRFSPLANGTYIAKPDATPATISNTDIGDFADPFYAEPESDLGFGVITSVDRFESVYLEKGLSEPLGDETWFKLREASMYIRVRKPAKASGRFIEQLTQKSSDPAQILSLMALDKSVRIIPYLSIYQSGIDSFWPNRN